MNRGNSLGPSLRGWLQSSALLAVVAGYSLLLLANQRLASWQREEVFRQSSAELVGQLAERATHRAQLERLLREQTSPGLTAAMTTGVPPRQEKRVSEATAAGHHWMLWVVPLDLVDGSRVFLQVRQDVSASVRQERLSFWFLVVAAGVSSLVTGVLLRLVLNRGLVRPLNDFSVQLRTLALPPVPAEALALQEQPRELEPIAEAFNNLQRRLWTSWEQQRVFADGVAHELRTPITLISGHAQSLLRHGAPAALTPSLRLICSEADRMSTLVSDLLDLARHDAQRLLLKRQTIYGDDALLALLERLAVKAGDRLVIEPGEDSTPAGPKGLGDPDRIQQCLTALVDNALRYSPEGSTITLSSSEAADGGLILHVCDRGPGVPEGERQRIFERFVRGEAAAAGDTRGSGIGLSVVKLLMEAMGGRADVVEVPGGGSDFRLHLQPLSPEAPPA
ncbi:MAG: sensor histidine kinase [Cyanobium sp.]